MLIDRESLIEIIWHRIRIITPFQNDIRSDLFMRKFQPIVKIKLHFIEKLPSLHKIEYLYLIKNKDSELKFMRTDKEIVKITKIEYERILNVWYPRFTVYRTNGKEWSFSEADFHSLNHQDFFRQYDILARIPKKNKTWSEAYQAVKRFMKNLIKLSYLTDFQMALEGGHIKVNVLRHNRILLDAQGILVCTVLGNPFFGIVFFNGQKKKKFMRFIEDNKYCDGTFRMIHIRLTKKLMLDEQKLVPLKDTEKLLINNALKAIEERQKYRNTLRRFEIFFGLRKILITPFFDVIFTLKTNRKLNVFEPLSMF